MNFEKQFPTLAKVKCRIFTDKCLMKMCLDKQRVKKAIESIMHGDSQSEDDGERILKELGLNE